jgi:ribosomal protein S5
MSVTDTRGTLNPLVPATIFTEHAGKNGDSGGIVRTASEGIGIYRGDLVTAVGTTEGRAQHLAQAEAALDLTLYE